MSDSEFASPSTPSPSSRRELTLCVVCRNAISLAQKAKKSNDKARQLDDGSWVHKKCDKAGLNREYYKKQKMQSEGSVIVDLPVYSSIGARCMFINCNNRDLHQVDSERRITCQAARATIIAKGALVCKEHLLRLVTYNFDSSLLTKVADSLVMTQLENTRFVYNLMIASQKMHKRPMCFSEMSDNELRSLIAMTRAEFEELISMLDFSGNDEHRGIADPFETLGLYFFSMRSGMAHDIIASVYKCSRQNVEHHVNQARKVLKEQFVPRNLGFSSLSSDAIFAHTTSIARELFGEDKMIAVLDGTYLFHQKSNNFDFQRLSFSLHKHRNLIKMFMVVSTDGYIIDATGPFKANASDADLLEDLFSKSEFTNLFQAGKTVLIVDRGFKNVIGKAEELNYEIYMPQFLENKQKQLTDFEANATRIVTKCRWVVEAANGQIKQTFRHFRDVISNRSLGNVPDDLRICCSLLNFLRKGGLDSDCNSPAIAARMIARKGRPNRLAVLVEKENLTKRRSLYISSNVETSLESIDQNPQSYGFPRLEKAELEIFTCGTYQIKLAPSYFAEHSKDDGRYSFWVGKEGSKGIDFTKAGITTAKSALTLIKTQIHSRHSKSVKYHRFILLNSEKEGITMIDEHWCSCKVGARTIGCCSHLATVIWFFCYACHNLEQINLPAKSLSTLLKEAEMLPTKDNEIDELIEGLAEFEAEVLLEEMPGPDEGNQNEPVAEADPQFMFGTDDDVMIVS